MGENHESKQKKPFPWGLVYIAATVVAVVLFGLFNREFGNVFRVMHSLRAGYLAAAVLVNLVYFVFEGGIIALLMHSRDVPMGLGSGMKIALIGLYYSYITPSATGGQPMQSAYLRRDKIPVGLSTAVLILKFFCFQCAFVLVSIVSFAAFHGKIAAENPGILPWIWLGLLINAGSILFFGSLFFRPVLHGVCGLAKALAGKIPFVRDKTAMLAAVDKFEGDFGSFSENYKGKAKSVVLGIALSVPQFILQMSVIYFVFLAFGYRDVPYGEVLAVQSLLQVSVSFMPMPGASGAQEIGFSAFFRDYFAREDLYAAVMVWRFFTYYLVVIAGALLVVIDQLLYQRSKRGSDDGEEE